MFLNKRYNNPLYSEWKLTYKENSSTQTVSKILDSRFNISNQPETQSVPEEFKQILDTATNDAKNSVKYLGNLSKLQIKQKIFFLYDNSNLVKSTYYTELNKKY